MWKRIFDIAPVFIALTCLAALSAAEPELVATPNPALQPVASAELWNDYQGSAFLGNFRAFMHREWENWSFDYRARSISSGFTSYEFGTPDGPPTGWAPISLLNFQLNSLWHGIGVGLEKPNWSAHFEWLTPMQSGIQGNLNDYDWMIQGADFTDLGITRERWLDGQMLDFHMDFRLLDHPFDVPIEIWPLGGFRYQRFDIVGYDLVQVKKNNVWPPNPYTYSGDVITFNQQYYTFYLGGQLRTQLAYIPIFPINLSLQGDIGYAGGYNIDHHLIREGDRYTVENTNGYSWHVAATAEAPLRKWLSLGFEADYLQIRTIGTHHWLNEPLGVDEAWDYGVYNHSEQTWLTAFIRVRI